MRTPARTQQASRGSRSIVANNVRIFDGIDGRLKSGNLLIADCTIKQVSAASITSLSDGAVIDGRGHVLMAGLTSAHWHMTMAANTMENLEQAG